MKDIGEEKDYRLTRRLVDLFLGDVVSSFWAVVWARCFGWLGDV